MRTNDIQTTPEETAEIFTDPVSYLAGFGIEAQLVEEPTLDLATAA
jgi:hypothetical protein